MQVLSSLSSIPFYAPSAGFAPTNSADVSAIASAYQVVSATATQLYAGTAYVTSVNDAPISAARAGNAANASMANSAYYDGTGRLISALPDEATVSSIASAYAESAASGKLDKTAQVVTAIGTGWNSDDDEIVSAVNGCILSADEARYAGAADWSNYARYDRRTNVPGYRTISSLPGSAEVSAIASSYAESAASSKLDATASSQFLTAVPDGYATTEYVDSSISGFAYESAVSGWTSKQDALTFGYNTADQISSIDGSALGGMDEAAVSAIASAYAESSVSSVSGNYYTTANESGYALSSDVSATVDIVSTQSANWGGSALALSAGPGVSLTLSGNTLVASTDETVLWSNDNGAATFTASEVITNFERIAVYVTDNPLSESVQRVEIPMMGGNLTAPKFSLVSQWDSSWRVMMWWVKLTSSDMKSFSISSAGFAGALTNSSWSNGNEPNYFRFYKVVGINRISGA